MAGGGSGEKTEKPTPKKRQEARKEGQVAKSVDLVQWVSLLVATYVLPPVIGNLLDQLSSATREVVHLSARGETGPIYGQVGDLLLLSAQALLPLFLIGALISIAGLAAQGGVVLSGKMLKPKWNRVSPKAGFKRIFSAQSAMETGKALIRITAFALVLWTAAAGTIRPLIAGTPMDLELAVPTLGRELLSILRLCALTGVVIGVADYLFQRHQVEKKLKMSKHEVKQEMKSSDGDPLIRGRRRQAHAKLSRNGMLAAVDDASVVVVNPTHVAVALRYAAGEGAPRVVAKGGDELARTIRERAMAAGVPVLEVRPLARLLHDTIKVGDSIPVELFEAVAIVLAFVMRNPRKAWGGSIRPLHVPVPVLAGAHDGGRAADGSR